METSSATWICKSTPVTTRKNGNKKQIKQTQNAARREISKWFQVLRDTVSDEALRPFKTRNKPTHLQIMLAAIQSIRKLELELSKD
jgi:hypothetical protein